MLWDKHEVSSFFGDMLVTQDRAYGWVSGCPAQIPRTGLSEVSGEVGKLQAGFDDADSRNEVLAFGWSQAVHRKMRSQNATACDCDGRKAARGVDEGPDQPG